MHFFLVTREPAFLCGLDAFRFGLGFPCGSAGKESACNAGDLGSIPGLGRSLGKIPWRRDRLPTPVFWPEEFHGLYSPWGRKESDTTELWVNFPINNLIF